MAKYDRETEAGETPASERKEYGTERICPDPIWDDVPFEAMKPGKKTDLLARGYNVTNSEKARSDADKAEGSSGVRPWKPKGR